jgi:hypothetical protein
MIRGLDGRVCLRGSRMSAINDSSSKGRKEFKIEVPLDDEIVGLEIFFERRHKKYGTAEKIKKY